MIKDLLKYILVFVFLFLIGYHAHQYANDFFKIKISFSLEKIYLFHAFFSAMICVNLRLLYNVNKFSAQVGFIYLGTFLVKLILFLVFFYNIIFVKESFHFSEKLVLLIPFLIFLLTETIFVISLLNKKV